MKLPAITLLFTLPAAALAGDAPTAAPLPKAPPLATPWQPDEAQCRDRIHQVREERGLPRLERETASPDKPVMIWAVDRREHGCAVMVVKGSPEDIRPLPKGSATVERIPAF